MEASEMHFEDQVAMVARAALLVGVHGAGLTHELFMPPGELQRMLMHDMLAAVAGASTVSGSTGCHP